MRYLRHRLGIQREESGAILWAWLFFFAVLSAYYVIRPIRDDVGVTSGVASLPWLFAGSLAGTLLANPIVAALAARLPRPRFVAAAYALFALNLVAFFALFRASPDSLWAGRTFFIWTSVFNMFAVSIFWSVMTEVFSTEQGKRLFGIIGAAGTIGSISGAALTAWLVRPIGAANLLLIAAGLLAVAVVAATRLFRFAADSRRHLHVPQTTAAVLPPPAPVASSAMGGSIWEGAVRSVSNPYFANVTLHMVLFTVLTTFLYFQQAELVDQAITDRAERTAFFANIDLIVNLLTLVTQTVATGWAIRVCGVTAALVFLPAVSVLGFGTLALAPSVGALMAFQVIRRAGNFAVNRPAREVLFTAVPARDRYKTKAFIDTFIYRAGDQMGAWLYALAAAVGLGMTGLSVAAAALGLASVLNAWWLGRRWQTRGESQPQRI